MLTERQRNVLDFIQREQREKGITPSTREIQSHFRFASQTSVMQYIAALERKGFLDRHARKARALITPAMKVRITDIPIYGQIPAGMSALTEQTVEGHVSLDMRSANVLKNRGTFALRVRGDSMIGAHIVDGDIVILEETKEVHDGDIVAALIDALNEDGYLPNPLEEIAELFPPELEIELEELSIALKYVQSFEPAGVQCRIEMPLTHESGALMTEPDLPEGAP